MSRLQDLLPRDEQLRLANCVREQIHVPGAVQSHGALLAVDVDTLLISQVSENTAALLDREPADLLAGSLHTLLGADDLSRISGLTVGESVDLPQAVLVPSSGLHFDALCHRVGDQLVVELEPSLPVDAEELLASLTTTIQHLSALTTAGELVAEAAVALRRITGFDRVMLYTFYPDRHGEVVADDHVDSMDDYLGLHYPASDIPQQSRSLFLKKACRAIVDSSHPGTFLLAAQGYQGPPLDLTLSELRAVSPHHLQFMTNMGQGATLSLSLVHRGELTGMITCAHRGTRRLPYQLRRALVMLANQLTLQLASIAETGRLKRELEIHRVRMALVQQMSRHDLPVDGLVGGDVTLLSLVPADGVTIAFAGESRSLGHAPAAVTAAALAELLRTSHPEQHYATVTLAEDHVSAAELVPDVAGIVFVPLGVGGDCIIWYRREVLQSVNWLGDQTADNRLTPLSPRNSFTMWKQTVAGRASAWDGAEIAEAYELRNDVNDVLLRRTQAQLAYQGLHDELTGLANRRRAIGWLSAAFGRAQPDGTVAALFVDIDRFKHINDSFGHAIGDEMIIAAANRLRAAAHETDIVARLGGDEFMVAFPDISLAEAGARALQILDRFAEPVRVQQQAIQMSVSVGLALVQTDSAMEPLDLLREADLAMYKAKSGGGNQLAVFEPALRPEAARRFQTQQDLGHCLERAELVLEYQPIFRLADGLVVGAEALLRWDRPGHGLTYPEDFVPILEDTGLIMPVGRWVLRTALTQLGAWRRAGSVSGTFCLAVNLSVRQFSDHSLVPELAQLLQEQDIPPAVLTLEITETAAMSAPTEITAAVEQLADLGVGVSLDDFGTGYSSLSLLHSLPVTQLKVDALFVAGLGTDERRGGLAGAVVSLAHQFRLTCVAEGVENPRQLAQLRELGCDLAQGFHLGMPVAAEEFTRVYPPI